MANQQLKIFSVNINGLNNPQKRRRTFYQLRKLKLKLDIICMQETHIKDEHIKFLEKTKLGKMYYASDKV